jgi:hypothetical protein
MIERLKDELREIENGIIYMEETDTAWTPEYTKLCKTRKILKKTIHKLEKLEAAYSDKD